MNPINPSRYGSQKPIDRKSNVEALYKIFREKKDKELIDLEANKFNSLKKRNILKLKLLNSSMA